MTGTTRWLRVTLENSNCLSVHTLKETSNCNLVAHIRWHHPQRVEHKVVTTCSLSLPHRCITTGNTNFGLNTEAATESIKEESRNHEVMLECDEGQLCKKSTNKDGKSRGETGRTRGEWQLHVQNLDKLHTLLILRLKKEEWPRLHWMGVVDQRGSLQGSLATDTREMLGGESKQLKQNFSVWWLGSV